MSKSVLSVLLLLLSCAVLFLIVQDTAGQPPLSQLYVDDDAWDALMEGREAYDGAVSVRFNEYELFRDHETGLLLYSLIEDHPKAYDPLVQADLHQQRARVAVRGDELTEDLIEASKASSGCVTVNAEKTDVNVLLSLALGEQEEALRAAGIEPILRLCEDTPIILADGRLLWRVFDNLFSNIRKYGQRGTRAYFASAIRDGRVEITFRNISAVELPVTGEELTERFVRGDASRHTEGSGLGLSIARSLTELQSGTFEIIVDGDLFKVTVSFSAV